MEDGRQGLSDNISEASSSVDRVDARALAAAAAAASVASSAAEDHTNKPSTPSNSDHFLSAFHSNGLHQQEHEARVEALQVSRLPERPRRNKLLALVINYNTFCFKNSLESILSTDF